MAHIPAGYCWWKGGWDFNEAVIEPNQWNKQKGRVRGNSERARIINATIETFENKAKQHYQQFLAKGKWITAHVIKDAVLGKEARQHSLMNQFNKSLF
jgi:hypothetical protein